MARSSSTIERSTRSARCYGPARSVTKCTARLWISGPTSSSRTSTGCGPCPILRVPGSGREPDLSERQVDARRRLDVALDALGGISSPGGSCIWNVMGIQRSVREWALRQGWGGRLVRLEPAKGILVAALGVLAVRNGYAAGWCPRREHAAACVGLRRGSGLLHRRRAPNLLDQRPLLLDLQPTAFWRPRSASWVASVLVARQTVQSARPVAPARPCDCAPGFGAAGR